MHSIKITPNLLFEYQCTSGKFIRLPNRIESKNRFGSENLIESNRNFFCPNWNALVVTSVRCALRKRMNRSRCRLGCGLTGRQTNHELCAAIDPPREGALLGIILGHSRTARGRYFQRCSLGAEAMRPWLPVNCSNL